LKGKVGGEKRIASSNEIVDGREWGIAMQRTYQIEKDFVRKKLRE
jgi:hypothetical protein